MATKTQAVSTGSLSACEVKQLGTASIFICTNYSILFIRAGNCHNYDHAKISGFLELL